MDTAKTGSLADPHLRAALESVAAAPVPSVGPDPTDEALALVAPDAGQRAEQRAFVAEARARFMEDLANRAQVPVRVGALRRELTAQGLAGFIVPHADEHLGEYIPLRSQRLTWITGFDGSAGTAIFTADAAALLVDGRYTLQARAQADAVLFEIRHLTEEPVEDWIREHLPAGGKLGYDPWHFTTRRRKALAKSCARAGGELVAVESNPVDTVWHGQPPPPLAPVVPHAIAFAGETHGDKRARIASDISKEGADAAVLTAPDSIAWLLNLRGADVPNTPLLLSFAILSANGGADLFLDARKLTAAARDHLGNEVRVRPVPELGAALDALEGSKVLADEGASAAWVLDRLAIAGAELVNRHDPCQLPKALKNDAELAGMRAAHVRDGAALTRFLAWLTVAAANGSVDELSAQEKLAQFRAEGDRFRGLSFDTISGAGPNSAVVHYRTSAATNRQLEADTLYLVDSGGQYLDGTTDVTRTVAIGAPSAEMRDRFTRVLKGHIALARARFPEGTTGAQLDTLARAPLWTAGLDFDHGTGHGVGAYLGVHEGPHGIAARDAPVKLRPGMVISNEPGYYRSGSWGIRIENLVTVVDSGIPEGGERRILALETITLAPIDRNLVDPDLMTPDEAAWFDAYHARVRETLSPLVDGVTREWLDAATASIV